MTDELRALYKKLNDAMAAEAAGVGLQEHVDAARQAVVAAQARHVQAAPHLYPAQKA